MSEFFWQLHLQTMAARTLACRLSACPKRSGSEIAVSPQPKRTPSSVPTPSVGTGFLFAVLLLGAGVSAQKTAQAQAVPDAGAVRQQIEQQRDVAGPRTTMPSILPGLKPAVGASADGLRIQVRSFRVAGNTLLRTSEIEPVFSNFINRELNFSQLQQVADAVAARYREAGWLVQAYLPEQDVSEGVITVQVVEARFAGLRLEGGEPRRVRRSELEAFFSAAQQTGKPLNVDKLDRALLIADDLPGVSLAGTLAPGAVDGETSLVLRATDEAPYFGEISLDNMGSRATGSERVTATLNINSPSEQGELISITAMRSEGLVFGRAAFTAPAGYDGLRLGLNASSLEYRVVSGPGAGSAVQINGRSGSMGLDVNYPLLRARAQNVYLQAGLDNKTFFTIDSRVRSDYATNSIRLGVSANLFDDWAGGGANSASLQWTAGQLADMQAHSLLDSIDRSYHKWNFTFTRQQTVSRNHTVALVIQGQQAGQLLDSSERFYIGGAQSVRAYPASELGGDRGRMASVEWRWRANEQWVGGPFIDHGRVVSFPTIAGEQRTDLELQGFGANLTWYGPKGLVAKLTWSRRDGKNPRPTATGTDSDGTLKLDRFWLATSVQF